MTKIILDNYPESAELDENVPYEDLCVWIDPIDNTRGFVNGKLEGVTILVGLARKELPFLGFIGIPYVAKNKERIFKPYLNMGYVSKSKAYRY